MARTSRVTKGPTMNHGDRALAPLSGEVLKDFPQLPEKTVIDVVNGMEVVGDHLRWRDENPSSMVSRCWDLVSGKSGQRQQALDRSVEGVLNGVKEWLTALQAAQLKSDIAIDWVAPHLLETRKFVKDLEGRHRHLQQDVTTIKQQIEHTHKQFSEIREDQRQERARSRAWNAVEWIKSRWESGGFDAFPPYLRSVLAGNNLYWSDFGAFLRLNERDKEDAVKLCEHARQTLAALTRDFAVGGQQGPAAIEDWLMPLAEIRECAERCDVAIYLLEDSLSDVQPLAASAASRLRGTNEPLPRNVPRLMLPRYLGEFAVREVERRITAEANGEKGTLS